MGLFVTQHILVSPDEYMCQLYANFFVDAGSAMVSNGPGFAVNVIKNCTQPWTDKGKIILQRVKGITDKMF